MQGFFCPSSPLSVVRRDRANLHGRVSGSTAVQICTATSEFEVGHGRANLHGRLSGSTAVQICTAVRLRNTAVQICTACPSSNSDVAVQICTAPSSDQSHPVSSGPHPVASRSHPGACPRKVALHCRCNFALCKTHPDHNVATDDANSIVVS